MRVDAALRWLERKGSKRVREDMLTRYGIVAPKAFGVSVGAIQQLAKRLGPGPRARRGAVGDRLVRGAHAGRVRRRPGAA